jgi:iron complex transport system substrate-binding protein
MTTRTLPRRRAGVAATALLAAAAALNSCSTGSTESAAADTVDGVGETSAVDEGAFPATIKHAFGTTTVEAEPKRVVTLGWSDQDVALSLGVVPVGAVAITWGGNDQQSTPWFDEALEKVGGEQPTRYSDADGAPVAEIAKLQPDLILATASGITKAEYTKLSRLAPVVAYPEAPWSTAWDDSIEMVGTALGRSTLADKVEDQVEAELDQAEADLPALEDKTFVFASLSAADTSKIDFYTPIDNRPRLLEDLGMDNAPAIEKLSKPGLFYGTVSAERAATLDSDVLITYGEKTSDLKTFTDDPLIGRIPALAAGHVYLSTDQTNALGMSAPTPLSIPFALDTFLPQVAKAIEGGPVTDSPSAG